MKSSSLICLGVYFFGGGGFRLFLKREPVLSAKCTLIGLYLILMAALGVAI